MKELIALGQIKGYGYDSFCLRFRYQIAREAQVRAETHSKYSGDRYKAQEGAKRDMVLRFFQNIDDLIGGHN